MEELKRILRDHAKRYPKMQPTDAVKLIYQNEFGGGHLIRDEQACLNYLRREYDTVAKDASILLYEDIGNGIVRVNLAAIKEEDLEQLSRDFVRSAADHKGNMDRFLDKLDVLKKLTKQGVFAFKLAELEDYLVGYEKAGFPAVSHSAEYRNSYRPAYRVLLSIFVRKNALLAPQELSGKVCVEIYNDP